MSDCCSQPSSLDYFPRKSICPLNGKEYGLVSTDTIKHHVKSPWTLQSETQGYYFCTDPNCSVVYFAQDNSVIKHDELRTVVGIKSKSSDALICYCYGITKTEAINDPLTRQFVVREKKSGNCACKARNPSGKCCLGDFPRIRSS